MELIVRNRDDLLSRLGMWDVYMSPFMRAVTHNIRFGKSHLLLPVIPMWLFAQYAPASEKSIFEMYEEEMIALFKDKDEWAGFSVSGFVISSS